MIDWLASMQQTFEYYIVDPNTWQDTKKLENVKSSSITRDKEAETLGSASFDITESVGECYIRTYLLAIQNGLTYKVPLGTHLVQTPSSSFNGKILDVSMDAYTPLVELKENPTPIGYAMFEGDDIMTMAFELARERMRGPVVKPVSDTTLTRDFVSEMDETWLSFISNLIMNAKYEFDLDEMGRTLFSPKQDTASLQPVWAYDDSNSSILYPDISIDHDLYGIPNVVEVIYTNGSNTYTARVVNDDENSPTSTISRGREIVYRDTSPALAGESTEEQIEEYANQLLRDLSSIEYTISYTHGYCPVRIGDCVMLNYERAGLQGIKAKVISQTIKCEPGCPVSEKAVFSTKLWR